MEKTKFQYKNNKVKIIMEDDNLFHVSIIDNKDTYKCICKDIEEVKSCCFELADNNDIGRVLSEKAHNWFYSKIVENHSFDNFDDWDSYIFGKCL